MALRRCPSSTSCWPSRDILRRPLPGLSPAAGRATGLLERALGLLAADALPRRPRLLCAPTARSPTSGRQAAMLRPPSGRAAGGLASAGVALRRGRAEQSGSARAHAAARARQPGVHPARRRQPQPRIQQIVDDLLDRLDVGHADRPDSANSRYPLPAIVIAELLGLPPDDREQFKTWSDEITAFLGTGRRRSRPAPSAASKACSSCGPISRGMIELRRAEPRRRSPERLPRRRGAGRRPQRGRDPRLVRHAPARRPRNDDEPDRQRAARAPASPRSTGAPAPRPGPHADRRRGVPALRRPGPAHLAPARPTTSRSAAGGCAGANAVYLDGRRGQPRPGPVPRAGRARRRPAAQPPSHLWARHPLLPRRAAGPAGGVDRASPPCCDGSRGSSWRPTDVDFHPNIAFRGLPSLPVVRLDRRERRNAYVNRRGPDHVVACRVMRRPGRHVLDRAASIRTSGGAVESGSSLKGRWSMRTRNSRRILTVHAEPARCAQGRRAAARPRWAAPIAFAVGSAQDAEVTLRYQNHWTKETDAHYEGMNWLYEAFARGQPQHHDREHPEPGQRGVRQEDPGRLRRRRLPGHHPRRGTSTCGTRATCSI